MAEIPTYTKSKTTIPQLLSLAANILDESKKFSGRTSRMDQLDKAYARYLDSTDRETRAKYGSQVCGQVINSVVNPIVVSQVNSLVAFWAETFLTGYPIFGVVSPPDQKEDAAALEGIIQDHMTLSQSVPELLKLLYDGAKYNVMAWDVMWDRLATYDPVKDMMDLSNDPITRVEIDHKHINFIKRLDFRNVHYDRTVPLVDADSRGRFIGKTELVNGTELLDYLQYLEDENTLTGTIAELAGRLKTSTRDRGDLQESTDWTGNYTSRRDNDLDWGTIFSGDRTRNQPSALLEASNKLFNKHTFYIRIRPIDYGIKAAGDPKRDHYPGGGGR